MTRRGYVLVLSLHVTALVAALAAVGLSRSVQECRVQDRSLEQHQAFALAEAGVDAILGRLRLGQFDDLAVVTVARGGYAAETGDPAGYPNLLANQRIIFSHGTAGSSQRNLEAITELESESVFTQALFGDQGVRISGSVVTDSYDSREGAYDPGTAGDEGDVGTNSTADGAILVNGSIAINGQAVAGYGADDPNDVLQVNGGAAVITGTPDVIASPEPLLMPGVVVPDGLACPDAAYSALTVLPPGSTHCFHNLEVTGGDDSGLQADERVTIYITGQLKVTGSATIGVAADPTRMVFLMASTISGTVSDGLIAGTSKFYGGLYAPYSTISIRGTADIYGAVVAQYLDVAGTAEVHYDLAMADLDGPVGGYRANIIAWREML